MERICWQRRISHGFRAWNRKLVICRTKWYLKLSSAELFPDPIVMSSTSYTLLLLLIVYCLLSGIIIFVIIIIIIIINILPTQLILIDRFSLYYSLSSFFYVSRRQVAVLSVYIILYVNNLI